MHVARLAHQLPALVIVGATAVGKSELAVRTAEALAARASISAEIVSADSVQMYRLLDIGAAKTTAELRARVPHHLLDVLELDEVSSAGDFAARAAAAIADVRARGRLPIVVGGTGFYVDFLVAGMRGPAPCGDTRALRAAVQAELTASGEPWNVWHARLSAVDPAFARTLQPNDWKRLARALEIARATGKPASTFAARRAPLLAAPGPGVPAARLAVLERARVASLRAIDGRCEVMLRRGLVRETVELIAHHAMPPNSPPTAAIGYADCIEFLRELERCRWTPSDSDAARAFERLLSGLQARTRQLARKQGQWCRALPSAHFIAVESADEAVDRLVALALAEPGAEPPSLPPRVLSDDEREATRRYVTRPNVFKTRRDLVAFGQQGAALARPHAGALGAFLAATAAR